MRAPHAPLRAVVTAPDGATDSGARGSVKPVWPSAHQRGDKAIPLAFTLSLGDVASPYLCDLSAGMSSWHQADDDHCLYRGSLTSHILEYLGEPTTPPPIDYPGPRPTALGE